METEPKSRSGAEGGEGGVPAGRQQQGGARGSVAGGCWALCAAATWWGHQRLVKVLGTTTVPRFRGVRLLGTFEITAPTCGERTTVQK